MSLDDERVRFYLRHRDQIEEWAALRVEAAQAVDEWLLGLRPAVEELAADLGNDVIVHVIDGPDFAWPSYRLARRGWPESSQADPGASVSLEWGRGKTTLRASSCPYVGLRCARERALGGLLRDSEETRKARARRKDTTSAWWVAYGYVAPDAPFPENADAYRERLLGALGAAWKDYAPIVDAALAAA
jgi:hypothetical protein